MAIDDNASYELTGYQVKDLAQKIRAKADSNSLASVATSGLYSDLTGAPTIPTVYNGTLTIQQNGTQLGTFSANQSSDTTINITGGGGTTYTAGNGISIDANNEISIDDTVVAEVSDLPTDFTGATASVAGAHGLVPAPAAGDDTKFLSGDGTWKTVSGGGNATKYYIGSDAVTIVTFYKDSGLTTAATYQEVIDALAAGEVRIYSTKTNSGTTTDTIYVTGSYSVVDNNGRYTISLATLNDRSYSYRQFSSSSGISNLNADAVFNNSAKFFTQDMVGATSSANGRKGYVPQPRAGDEAKVLHGDGTWKDTTAKLVEMSYGESNAWAKFIAAYNAGSIVYCRASSNSNPASGSQTRKAFMAYVNNATAPTEVEFQYVRSMSSKTDSQQSDQVFIYKLTNASGGTWSVETRSMAPKINVSGPITKTFTTGANATVTIGADAMTGATSSAAGTAGVVPAPAAGDQNKVLKGDGTWVSQGEEFIGEFTTGSSFTLPAGYKIYHIRGFAQYGGASSNAGMWMTRTNRTGTGWLRRINGSAGGVQWGEWSYTDGHFVLLGSSEALAINGGKVAVDLTITVTNSTLWMTSGNFSHSGSQDSGVVFSETTTSDASADTTLQFASTGRTFQAMDIIVTGIKQ